MKTDYCAHTRTGRPVFRGPARWFGVGLVSLASLLPARAEVKVETLGGGPLVLGAPAYGYVDGDTKQVSQFHTPFASALDGGGNLYVADRDNSAIRKLDVTGNRTTTFATGLAKPVDVLLDGADNVYALCQGDGTIRKFDRFRNYAGQVAGGLANPTAFAMDSDSNIYVAEMGGAIKRIAAAGGVTVVATGFSQPQGLEVLDNGQLAVSDTGNHAIVTLNPLTGTRTMLAGGSGPGFADGTNAIAKFNQPHHLAKAPNGTLVVADTENHKVRLVATNGLATTLYGVSPVEWTPDFPGWEDGNVDFAASRQPVGVTVANNGDVFVTEAFWHIIRQVTGTGLTSGSGGTGTNIVVQPPGISPDSGYFPMGQLITVASPNNDVFFTTDGTDPTTNGTRVNIAGNTGYIWWHETLRDLTSLRVRAFIGTNASVVVRGQSAPVNNLGVTREVLAGIGSTVVVPVVANLQKDQPLRSIQFRVEVTPVDAAPPISDRFRPLNVTTNDFIPLVGPAKAGAAASLSFSSYALASTRGVVISAVGTNSNFSVDDFAVVTMLAIPIPPTAHEGDSYSIAVVQPSGTSDGLQAPVPLTALAPATLRISSLPYTVGDSAPGGWYNAGEFGNGNLNNNDVNNAFYASLGIRLPYNFTDAFDAMDAFPDDTDSSVGGDGQIRFLDWQRILQRSLRLNVSNWSRRWNTGGERIAVRTNLTDDLKLAAAPKPSVKSGGETWVRQALLGASTVQQVRPGDVVKVPVYLKVRAGQKISGMAFRASITPENSALPLDKAIQFVPGDAMPTPIQSPGLSPDTLLCGWSLGSFQPSLQSSNLLGFLQFTVPDLTFTGQHYRVRFAFVDGAPDDQTQYDFETVSAFVYVGMPAPTALPVVSDEWRIHYFGSLENTQAQANVDADGDGVPNWAEFLAGTDPTSLLSRLQMLTPERRSNAGQTALALRWESAPGRLYTIESATDVASGAWSTVAANVPGVAGVAEYLDTRAGPEVRFYRVRVQP